MEPIPAIPSTKNRLSWFWFLPLLSTLLAVWMLFDHLNDQGIRIAVTFTYAEGVEVGKTKVRSRSVDLGVVESIGLSDGWNQAVVVFRVKRDYEALFKGDTSIWIVRPRIGKEGVSGVGTLLSGAYLEVMPGTSQERKTSFVGLESPPYIPSSGEGLRVQVVAHDAESLSVGDPVLFRGFPVGKVEMAEYRPDARKFLYQVFIRDPYSKMVCEATRFWNAGGFSLEFGVDGISWRTYSLESLLTGGIAFDLPPGLSPGAPCETDHEFSLYRNYEEVLNQPYQHFAEYLLLFDSSVRGLKPGAPVEYRGIRIGSVIEISLRFISDNPAMMTTEVPIPVLIRIDPGRLGIGDTEAGVNAIRESMQERVQLGMRAMLETGNLLTGSMYVGLDYLVNPPESALTEHKGYSILPTSGSGLAQVERKVTQLLDHWNQLPWVVLGENMNEALSDVRNFSDSGRTAFEAVQEILRHENTRALPDRWKQVADRLDQVLQEYSSDSGIPPALHDALRSFRDASRSFDQLSEQIRAQPNSLIFPRELNADPKP